MLGQRSGKKFVGFLECETKLWNFSISKNIKKTFSSKRLVFSFFFQKTHSNQPCFKMLGISSLRWVKGNGVTVKAPVLIQKLLNDFWTITNFSHSAEWKPPLPSESQRDFSRFDELKAKPSHAKPSGQHSALAEWAERPQSGIGFLRYADAQWLQVT